MKCQLAGQTLRLRIDEAELDHLLRGGMVEDTTAFAPTLCHTRRLWLAEVAAPELRLDGSTLSVVLPQAQFESFAAERPRRDALDFEWPVAGAEPLRVGVQIDVRDSHRRRHDRSNVNPGSID